MTDRGAADRLTLKAFLSHRYQQPAVNLYFYDLFSEVAEVQFDVDGADGSTNVTRLERMIRSTDAFVGIYPYDGDGQPTRAELLKASRYFRLEMDLAVRARTPAIVFVDRRYGSALTPPASMFRVEFDYDEVTGSGGSPNRDGFRLEFERFCRNVEASMRYEQTRPARVGHTVSLALPPDVYGPDEVRALEEVLEEHNSECRVLPWPVRLDGRTMGRIQASDWVVTDVASPATTALTAYLHGQAVPTLRLAHAGTDLGVAPAADVLFGPYEVGYAKDVLRWSTPDELRAGVEHRLARILQADRRIGDRDLAREYFLEASRRKEAVFLSYSGADLDAVGPVAEALRKRFWKVFDYRDGGQSIRPGRPWIEEIFATLDRVGLVVLMLSDNYLRSGNCLHEAREATAARDAGKLMLVPVKLDQGTLEFPPEVAFLRDVQYVRGWEHASPDAIVDLIASTLDTP